MSDKKQSDAVSHPAIVARHPDEVPIGWSGLVRYTVGMEPSAPRISDARKVSDRLFLVSSDATLHAQRVSACFDFPVDEMLREPGA